jgi:hypothetical protein
MPHDVFVSYASKDQTTALAVVHALEAAGIRCWIAPRDVKVGSVWAQSIVDAISGCKVFVVVFSASANRSGHIINEVDAAVRKGAMVIPFRIENVMPEGAMEYHLRTRHWLDALTPELSRHLEELIATVRKLLERPVPVADQTEFMRLDRVAAVRTTEPSKAPPPTESRSPTPPPVSASKARPAFESTDSGFHLKVPRLSVAKRIWMPLTAIVVAIGVMAGWLLTEKSVVTGAPFEVRSASGGNSWSVRMTVDQIRFFEGPSEAPRQRQYGTTFTTSQTRYLHTELAFKFSPPGRQIVVPVGCTIFSANDAVVGSFTIQSTIDANASQWFNARAWGAEQPGSWKAGRYRVDCSYGEKLIARRGFQVIE